MVLRLIGHYDSPFVRRVGVSLHVLGIPFERGLLSVFGDAEEMRAFNPLVRVPALVLDDGECLIDSAAILDHLDEIWVPGERCCPPVAWLAAMRCKNGARNRHRRQGHRHRLRAPQSRDKIDETWIARCRNQQEGALAELERRYGRAVSGGRGLMQPEITVAAMLGYLRLRQPETVRAGRYPALEALSARAEADPAFRACLPAVEEIGGSPAEAKAALLRLQGTQSPA